MTSTLEQARKDFTPLLKRGGVLDLGARLGITERTMRLLIEGADAPVKRHEILGKPSQYFKLEDVLAAVMPDNSALDNGKSMNTLKCPDRHAR